MLMSSSPQKPVKPLAYIREGPVRSVRCTAEAATSQGRWQFEGEYTYAGYQAFRQLLLDPQLGLLLLVVLFHAHDERVENPKRRWLLRLVMDSGDEQCTSHSPFCKSLKLMVCDLGEVVDAAQQSSAALSAKNIEIAPTNEHWYRRSSTGFHAYQKLNSIKGNTSLAPSSVLYDVEEMVLASSEGLLRWFVCWFPLLSVVPLSLWCNRSRGGKASPAMAELSRTSNENKSNQKQTSGSMYEMKSIWGEEARRKLSSLCHASLARSSCRFTSSLPIHALCQRCRFGCRPSFLRPLVWRLLVHAGRDFSEELVNHQPTRVISLEVIKESRTRYSQLLRDYAGPVKAVLCEDEIDSSGKTLGHTPPLFVPAPSSSARGTELLEGSIEARWLHQIFHLDLPRHKEKWFECRLTRKGIGRCGFLWAHRHPAVGYVQGMDDIIFALWVMFFVDEVRQCSTAVRHGVESEKAAPQAFSFETHLRQWVGERFHFAEVVSFTEMTRAFQAAEHVTEVSCAGMSRGEIEEMVMDACSQDASLNCFDEAVLQQVEGDTYACANWLLEHFEVYWVGGQPGVFAAGKTIEKVLMRARPTLSRFIRGLGDEGGEPTGSLQTFCFSWIHSLLSRQLPLPLLYRVWDTYLVLGQEVDLSVFHAYTCSSIIVSMEVVLMKGKGGETVDSSEVVIALRQPFSALFGEESQGLVWRGGLQWWEEVCRRFSPRELGFCDCDDSCECQPTRSPSPEAWVSAVLLFSLEWWNADMSQAGIGKSEKRR